MEMDAATAQQDVVRFVVAAGSTRWPGVTVDGAALEQRLAQFSPASLLRSPALAADWYLAFACSTNAPRAIQHFQSAYTEAIDAGARTVDSSRDFVEEVRQRAFELLLVGSSKAGPRIVQYRGQGPLAAWLRTTAKRLALRVGRGGQNARLASEDVLANELADACDQELALLRAHYGELFREVLVGAIRELPQRDRMLLQLSFVGGVSTVRIAKMYHVSQSTISRQLQQAAHDVFEAVKNRLRAELGVASQEFESILAIVRSHIEMTLSCFEEASDQGSSLEKS